jgi:hypothetical protein
VNVNLLWLLVIVCLVLAIGGLPLGGAGHGWYGPNAGYFPTGFFGIVLIVLVVLLLTGRI